MAWISNTLVNDFYDNIDLFHIVLLLCRGSGFKQVLWISRISLDILGWQTQFENKNSNNYLP